MRRITASIAVVLVVTACGDSSPPSTTTATTSPADQPAQAVALEPSEGVERSEPSDAPIGDLVAGFSEAGFELMRTQDPAENLVFSPLSIGHALLMARGAADPPTAEAIDEAFGLPEGHSAHQAWNALDHALAGSSDAEEDITVSIADRIWPRIDVEPEQEWIDLLAAEHGVSIESLDFQGAPEESRRIINGWVADQTQDLIPELLPEGFIDLDTVLVLTDAIYFEARWQTVFGKYPSESGTFTALDGSSSRVTFMHELELSDARGTGDGYRGAEIPYVGRDYSMLLIVPEQGRYEEIRGRLGQDFLDEVDSTFAEGSYELFMPQWDDHTDLDLYPWLVELGIAPGSFPAIDPDAFLGGAVHGADISVDKEGTVAAAATGLGFNESGPPEPEFTIRADRPYLYFIRHRPTGAVLFAGQVTDPAG